MTAEGSALEQSREALEVGAELDAQGGISGLTQEEVVARYAPLVKQIVHGMERQFGLRRSLRGDMMADANAGLLDAWQRYEEVEGVSFSSYAYYRIRGEVVDGLRRAGVMRRSARSGGGGEEVRLAGAAALIREAQITALPSGEDTRGRLAALDEAVRAFGAAYLTAAVVEAEIEVERPGRLPSASLLDAELRALIEEALAGLSEVERATIRAVYYDDRRLSELGEEHGLSRSWLCRVHMRALDRIERQLRGTGWGRDG